MNSSSVRLSSATIKSTCCRWQRNSSCSANWRCGCSARGWTGSGPMNWTAGSSKSRQNGRVLLWRWQGSKGCVLPRSSCRICATRAFWSALAATSFVSPTPRCASISSPRRLSTASRLGAGRRSWMCRCRHARAWISWGIGWRSPMTENVRRSRRSFRRCWSPAPANTCAPTLLRCGGNPAGHCRDRQCSTSPASTSATKASLQKPAAWCRWRTANGWGHCWKRPVSNAPISAAPISPPRSLTGRNSLTAHWRGRTSRAPICAARSGAAATFRERRGRAAGWNGRKRWHAAQPPTARNKPPRLGPPRYPSFDAL